ncbi:MAG: TraB/GumN family protein [Geobacter sp.]|nr:TraB/GumN family protein [Geobacter sp.]
MHLKSVILSLLTVLLCCSAAMAESSVWKAEKNGAVIYLGGTIHLLRQSDYPLPTEFDKAYKAADLVMFETDIDLLNDPATQMKLLAQGVYGDGSTVDRHLSPKVYAELSSYCQANGIPLQQFSRFRPAMLMTILTMLELKKLGISEEGVDAHYFARAKKERKPVKWLETADEQLGYLVTIADGHEDEFVSYSLKDLLETSEQLEMLTAAWLKGDGNKIDGTMVAEMKTAAPYIYKKLLLERNRNWLPIILAEQKPSKTLFILVGVAHLVGPDGLVESLKKSGYKVEKL